MADQPHALYPCVRIGQGALERIGDMASELGTRALLVTHLPGRFTATGIVERTERLLRMAGVESARYGVEPECAIPTYDTAASMCRDTGCDLVIGLGGGSALDAAKGIAIMATHQGSIRDYQMGEATLEHPSLPVIAVPTTAGTGSEVSRVVVVGNQELRIKKSISDSRLIPRAAILDPELCLPLAPDLTCSTGIDALSHALESFVSLNATRSTKAAALWAFELIGRSLQAAVADGQNITARRDLLFASYMAGLSLQAGVGAAHILAQPVSAVTGLSHSLAIAVLLPHVVRANLEHATQGYASAARALSPSRKLYEDGSRDEAAGIISAVKRFGEAGGLPSRFRDAGVSQGDLEDILETALRWQMHIQSNPRPVDRSMLRAILQAAY